MQINSQISGLEEIIIMDDQSDTESLVNISIDLPKIPKSFNKLYDNFKIDKSKLFKPSQICDCCDKNQQLVKCPHFQDPYILAAFQILPKRLAHLDFVNPKSKQDIRQRLFEQLVTALQNAPCSKTQDTVEFQHNQELRNALIMPGKANKVKPEFECHVYRDLKILFPVEYDKFFEIENVKYNTMQKQSNTIINLSFASNIILLVLKIIAFALSLSMSVMSSMVDSAMDIASGLVLYITVRLAGYGIKSGNYQKTLHDAETNMKVKYLYAQRYESLGVLAFSSIMGTLSIVLIYEAINQIISIQNGSAKPIQFDAIPMSIIIFTIVVKLMLFISCWIVLKKSKLQSESLKAYKDDHRNDILSNIVGLIGALLAFYLKGGWTYVDPIFSIVLLIYIFVNWFMKGIEQMKNLSGHKTDQSTMDEYMMRLLHQFMCSIFIKEVGSFIGYTSGSKTVIEIRITVPNTISIAGSHQVCQTIQNVFENMEEIERCYVHVESTDSTNSFELI